MTGTGPVERLRNLLETEGHAWPAPLEHFERLASTSDHLKERARAGAPEWTVAWADEQTAGRGRQGHTWFSPAGNLFLSVLLRPRAGGPTTTLPLMAGVAVADALRQWGVDARLKWPNDVLAGGRKLAGILVEGLSSPEGPLTRRTGAEGPLTRRTGPEGLEAAVVGVGVNLVLDPRALPAELKDRVTSVLAETSRVVDTDAAAAAVLHGLTVWYHALTREEEGTVRVLDAWRERSVPWWGHAVEVTSGGSVLRGRAIGIDPAGALLLEREDGSRVAVVSGEVLELRRAEPSS